MADATHVLIANPTAGGGRARGRLPEALAALDSRGIAHRLVESTSIVHACEEARRAAEAGQTVLVMSGDGMVGKVGGVLAFSDATMGVIPGGRGNDLARVIGIPTEPAAAVDVIAAGRTRMIDVGEIDGERFLCIASLGFDSDANRIANDARLVRGPLVYLYAALRALAAWRPARFRVTVDGAECEFEGWSVIVANSKAYGGGMFVAPEAELDDGALDVVMISGRGKLRFLGNLPSVFKGRHLDNPNVASLRGAVVDLDADRPFTVYADGDPIAELPSTVTVLDRALRILAPPP